MRNTYHLLILTFLVDTKNPSTEPGYLLQAYTTSGLLGWKRTSTGERPLALEYRIQVTMCSADFLLRYDLSFSPESSQYIGRSYVLSENSSFQLVGMFHDLVNNTFNKTNTKHFLF